MTSNKSKPYLAYLNKLVDQYNTYHHSIGKKGINADYSAWTEKIEMNLKAPKLMIEPELRNIRIFLVMVTFKTCQLKFIVEN